MTRRPLALRGLATLVVTAAALTLGAAPAQAATYNHDDAVGDVRGVGTTSGDGRFTSRPQERAADITQMRVRHGEHRLIMRLETVNLTRRDSLLIGPVFIVRTPKARYTAQVAAISFRRSHEREVEVSRGGGRPLRCDGVFADFDFAGDVSMISIPRRCLGNPRRVTVGGAMARIDDKRGDFVLDSAMQDGRVLPLQSSPPIRSAAVTAR